LRRRVLGPVDLGQDALLPVQAVHLPGTETGQQQDATGDDKARD
jgi:hypothetical protein